MYYEISALENSREEGDLKAKQKLAKSLLDVLDIKTIAQKTGLTEEIKRL